MKDMRDSCCEMCSSMGGKHWMHVLIRVAVAIIIFWCGVQFGELKSAIRNMYYGSSYGYGMMNGWNDGRAQNYYYGAPMMRYYQMAPTATTTTKTR